MEPMTAEKFLRILLDKTWAAGTPEHIDRLRIDAIEARDRQIRADQARRDAGIAREVYASRMAGSKQADAEGDTHTSDALSGEAHTAECIALAIERAAERPPAQEE